MPRLDRTFSEKDIFRIYHNNLTESEQKLVVQYFTEELDEELVAWPEPLCYYLGEILQLLAFGISVSISVWDLSRISLGIVEYFLAGIEKGAWIPIFGDIWIRDIERLRSLLVQFDARTMQRLKLLDRHLVVLREYVEHRCE